LERFRQAHGVKPLRGLHRQHISAVIGAKADKPEAANHLLKTLRIILAYAVVQGMIEANPAAGIKKYRSPGDGYHSWSESEVAQFEQRHPVGSKARLALALGLYTAQRKSDCLRMGWQHVTGDAIAVRQQKTAAALLIPMHPHLVAALASVPRTNLTFRILHDLRIGRALLCRFILGGTRNLSQRAVPGDGLDLIDTASGIGKPRRRRLSQSMK
jgi:integrase